ncbi:MAG: UvrD-helicase domain-containing protein [Dehalococcoidales bacterium]|nr:MAG: UvrD-helicase domain-containing protein [Dehalococcoidales bacterium]
MDILTNLNPAQKEAAEAIGGPVLILAGPGSGKTRVITHRVAYLIKTCGVSPRSIMAVTFTNKAAREMEDRLNDLISSSVQDLTLGTFHAICVRILRTSGSAANIDPQFVIYDREDQISVVKRSIQEADFDPKQYAPGAILSAISSAKSRMLSPVEFVKTERNYFDEVVGRVYENYQRILDESNALDFDDLLMKTVMLFRNYPDILARYQSRYVHLMVDEFQDTNIVQYELIKQIGGKYRNICVVGDPDQSIYSWRFANVGNILNFEKDYPDAKVVMLEENYRSTKTILETASCIISANQQRKPVNLWTQNDDGTSAVVVETYTEQEEAQFVVSEIERLVEKGEHTLGECAVMYRTNAQSRVLEEAFVRYGMPYKLVAGTRFYERREVKDIIAYLRLIQNPHDSVSLMRVINVPQRGIGQQTQLKLAAWAKSMGVSQFEALRRMNGESTDDLKSPFNSHISRVLKAFSVLMEELISRSQELKLPELFDLVIERSGYKEYILNEANGDGQERWENILELRSVAQKDYGDLSPKECLATFLEEVTLVSDVDGLEEGLTTVTLITLHQAKGLEFPVVFIAGMEDGLLPHFRTFDDPMQMEEERRLCYVGVTRAKRLVYLVRAFRRSLMGRSQVSEPSRFLGDIPKHLISTGDWKTGDDDSVFPSIQSWNRPTVAAASTAAPGEYQAGDHVYHAQFGKGVVVSCQPVKNDSEIVIAFNGAVKKLLLSFANLEKTD